VKRTGRDEPIWAIIHTCMETAQGISLYSYLYLKLAKTPCFSYFLCFFFYKIRRQEGRTGSAWIWGGEVVLAWGEGKVSEKGVGG
jgi:hypothetical protein